MPLDTKVFEKFSHFVVSEIEEGFAHVQFNNPKTLNAFADEDWKAYHEILVRLDGDPSINVILVSSNVPKAFTSGLNLKAAISLMMEATTMDDCERYKNLYDHIGDFQYCISTAARIRTPTIGLLNGINYGLAMDISSTFSIRVATEDVRMSIREIKIGIPADMGSLQRLPALVNNKSLLYQYALTGKEFGAQDALKLGYVSQVTPDLKSGIEHCIELGKDINQHQQWAIKGTKESLQNSIDGVPVDQGLKNIQDYNATNIDQRFINAIMGVKL
jgi:delta(3,5)-delta(2,4)-dienoyl-CoA isomerase